MCTPKKTNQRTKDNGKKIQNEPQKLPKEFLSGHPVKSQEYGWPPDARRLAALKKHTTKYHFWDYRGLL